MDNELQSLFVVHVYVRLEKMGFCWDFEFFYWDLELGFAIWIRAMGFEV